MVMVLTLSTTATMIPMTNSIQCVERLYQPETRSIELSNHVSIFACAFWRSPWALSTTVRSARWTCGLPIVPMLARSVSNEILPAFGWLLTKSTSGPRTTMSITACAKLRLGMYVGRFRPRVSAVGHHWGHQPDGDEG